MKKLCVTAFLITGLAAPNLVLAQETWEQREAESFRQNRPVWLREDFINNREFYESKFDVDIEAFVLTISGYGVGNTVSFVGVSELISSMVTFPLKDGSRPKLVSAVHREDMHTLSFQLMGAPLDFRISNYPNAAHHGKISEIESIVFRGRQLDKPELMAQLDSMADQYALAQRQEEKIQEALAKRRIQAETAEQEKASLPGNNDADTGLSARYAAAIQKAVLRNWTRPENVPQGQQCIINIRQLPGGEVVDVEAAASCPYDKVGRLSVEAAVLKAQPLPYSGFESAFRRNLTLNFTAQDR